MNVQYSVLEQLADGTEPGGMPCEPVSCWHIESMPPLEATGEYAEQVWRNREIAMGFEDPATGFLSQAEVKDERDDYADALALAKRGGEVDLGDQLDQGHRALFAPELVDGKPNEDAFALLYAIRASSEDGLGGWRHERNADSEERRRLDGDYAPAADLPRGDALSIAANMTLREGGAEFSPLDEEDMAVNAPDLLVHVNTLRAQQRQRAVREYVHGVRAGSETRHLLRKTAEGWQADPDRYVEVVGRIAGRAPAVDPWTPHAPREQLLRAWRRHRDAAGFRRELHRLVRDVEVKAFLARSPVVVGPARSEKHGVLEAAKRWARG